MQHWRPRSALAETRQIRHSGWVNVYRLFSSGFIWPRGIPLELLEECQKMTLDAGRIGVTEFPIHQGLVNGSPDVDAIWRLIFDKEFSFDEAPSVWLAPGTWSPFNSQSTWWFRTSFPLLYLPSFVSFRVTDIWRSFIAQRCLWELGHGVVFHGPESIQQRNIHNLLIDLEQEIPGYLNNNRIISILEGIELVGGVGSISANLHQCYEALANAGIVPVKEIPLVEAWLLILMRAEQMGFSRKPLMKHLIIDEIEFSELTTLALNVR